MELATTRERSRTGHTRREPVQGERQGSYIIEIGGEIVSSAVFIRAEELAQELEISHGKSLQDDSSVERGASRQGLAYRPTGRHP